MSLISLFILALGLSIDAFAASVGRGAATGTPHLGAALKAGAVFGLTEMVTPLIGWAVGATFADYVGSIAHWIAFVLLVGVGGHMAWHAFDEEDADEPTPKGGLISLMLTAIGTSIDAMAVGVSLALLDVNILVAAPIIGATTFVMTTIGMMTGKKLGETIGPKAEFAGGIALALIGAAIVGGHYLA